MNENSLRWHTEKDSKLRNFLCISKEKIIIIQHNTNKFSAIKSVPFGEEKKGKI